MTAADDQDFREFSQAVLKASAENWREDEVPSREQGSRGCHSGSQLWAVLIGLLVAGVVDLFVFLSGGFR